MNRKDFIRHCAVKGLALTSVGALFTRCAAAPYYAFTSMNGNELSFAKSEFAGERNGEVFVRDFVLLKTDRLEFPVCVYRIDDDTFIALDTRCTHQGCEVKPQGDFLVCPCHGSEFSKTGKVVNPPADEDLKRYVVRTDDTMVYVHL